MNILKTTFIIGSALLIATSAAAEGPIKHADKDGIRPRAEKHVDLTRDAALEKAAARFDKIDTNGDGVLSSDERKAGRKAMGKKAHKDEDGKGRAHEGAFKVFDQDDSGYISSDEFEKTSARFFKGKGDIDAEKVAKRFSKIDKDGDGKISQAEMKEAGKDRKVNKNHKWFKDK